MKRIIIITALNMLAFGHPLGAQTMNAIPGGSESGVYRTYEAYKSHQLTDSVNTAHPGSSLKDNAFDQVVLRSQGHKEKYGEGEIYAYKLKGNNYRFFNAEKTNGPKGYFEIADESGLIIYRQTRPDTRGNNEVSYYYSRDEKSPVKPCTRENLIHELRNKAYVTAVYSMKDVTVHKDGKFRLNEIYNSYKSQPADF